MSSRNTKVLNRSLDDTSVFNMVNALRTLAYDKAGSQTDDGRHYTYVYDAFGRLRQVKSCSTSAVVADCQHNGLGMRIGWHSA